MKIKLTTQQAKDLLPQTVRLTYEARDVLESALMIGEENTIMCGEDINEHAEFTAVYKLVRVEKR